MATMRDRTRFPPGQWQMIHPEAGQSEPWKGSFSEIVTLEAKFRAKNPALVAKHNWSLNLADIENDVDVYNAQRMIAGGFLGFVHVDAIPPAPSAGGARRITYGLGVAVDNAVTGLAIYRELFSGQSQPVAKDEAERRAAVCAGCPQNKRGGFKEFFVAQVAKGLTELLSLMRERDLTTSRDKELGTCAACDCPLPPKVYVALETARKRLRPEQLAALDSRCWILKHDAT